VRERHLSIGAYLDVGAAVATIVKMDPLRLRLAVPERESGSVRVGQTVRLRSDGGAVQAEGKVVRLSPAVDEKTRTLIIEAEIPNKEGALRPGAFASADVVIDPESPAVLVPADSLVTFAGITKVLGVTDGRIVEKRVRVGRRSGDRLEVLEGVTPATRSSPSRAISRPASRSWCASRARCRSSPRSASAVPCSRRCSCWPSSSSARSRTATRRRPLPGRRHPAGPRPRDPARCGGRGDRDRDRAAPRRGRQHGRGLDELRSISGPGAGVIAATFQLSRDVDVAAQDVRDRVSGVLRDLPPEMEPPVVAKFDNESTPVLTVALSRPTVAPASSRTWPSASSRCSSSARAASAR
jgi:hypothetical protein